MSLAPITTGHGPDGSREGGTVLALCLFTVFAGFVALRNLEQLNPDAFVYLRIARYYLEGNFGLAINGYWGPLLSVVLAPLLAATQSIESSTRLAMLLSAVLFMAGSARLFAAFRLQRPLALLAMFVMVPSVTLWSVSVATPDLLMGGLFVLGLAYLLEHGDAGCGRRPALAGFLFGLSFLAKSVALPMAIGVVLVVQLGRYLVGGAPIQPLVRHTSTMLATLLLVTAPWVAVLSMHYGELTVSTSARAAHSLAGPGQRGAHPVFLTHQRPREGRVSSLEDPTQRSYAYWSPFDSIASFRHQLELIGRNLRAVADVMSRFDLTGFALVLVLLAFVLDRPFRAGFAMRPWRWSLPCVAVMLGIYLPVFAGPERYHWVAYPLLVGCSIAFTERTARRALEPLRLGARPARVLRALVLSGVGFSFFLPQIPELWWAIDSPGNKHEYQDARSISARLSEPGACSGAIAGVNDRRTALYVAMILDRVFLGSRRDGYDLDELTGMGAAYLVSKGGGELSRRLERDPGLEKVDTSRFREGPEADWRSKLYRIRAARCP